jgi:hypothetical protein
MLQTRADDKVSIPGNNVAALQFLGDPSCSYP